MRGKVAREIRKLAEFDPRAKRNYFELNHVVRERIYQFGKKLNEETGEEEPFMDEVVRDVDKMQLECTDIARKRYQFYKKYYNNCDIEGMELNPLPKEEDINDIKQQYKRESEQLRQEVRTTGSGGVSDGAGQSDGASEQDGEPDA